MRNFLIVISLFVVSLVEGNEGSTFLTLPYGNARPVILPYTGLHEGVGAEAILYNPAALANIKGKSLSFMGSPYMTEVGVNHYSFAYAQPVKKDCSIGVGVTLLNYGKEKKYGIEAGKPKEEGNFSAYDLLFTVGCGRKIKDINFGAKVKFGSSKIDDKQAELVAFDLGAMYYKEKYAIGISAQNIPVIKQKFVREKAELPTLVKVGTSFLYSIGENHKILFATEIIVKDKVKFSTGVEYNFPILSKLDKLALRLGYSNIKDIGAKLLIGGGILYSNVNLDYSYQSLSELGASHNFSVSTKL